MRNLWLPIAAGLIVVVGCGSTDPAGVPPGTAPEAGASSAPTPAGAAPDQASPAPAEEPPANTLKWTTASEVDNFGFDIYRSLDEDGPFVKITAEPLPGAGTTDEPQRYIFVDEDIDPTRDYYYYIESISLGGIREIFSPTIKAPAKAAAPQDD